MNKTRRKRDVVEVPRKMLVQVLEEIRKIRRKLEGEPI